MENKNEFGNAEVAGYWMMGGLFIPAVVFTLFFAVSFGVDVSAQNPFFIILTEGIPNGTHCIWYNMDSQVTLLDNYASHGICDNFYDNEGKFLHNRPLLYLKDYQIGDTIVIVFISPEGWINQFQKTIGEDDVDIVFNGSDLKAYTETYSPPVNKVKLAPGEGAGGGWVERGFGVEDVEVKQDITKEVNQSNKVIILNVSDDAGNSSDVKVKAPIDAIRPDNNVSTSRSPGGDDVMLLVTQVVLICLTGLLLLFGYYILREWGKDKGDGSQVI